MKRSLLTLGSLLWTWTRLTRFSSSFELILSFMYFSRVYGWTKDLARRIWRYECCSDKNNFWLYNNPIYLTKKPSMTNNQLPFFSPLKRNPNEIKGGEKVKFFKGLFLEFFWPVLKISKTQRRTPHPFGTFEQAHVEPQNFWLTLLFCTVLHPWSIHACRPWEVSFQRDVPVPNRPTRHLWWTYSRRTRRWLRSPPSRQ